MLFLVLVADFFVLVLVFVNGIVIFSFLVIFVFVFVNENHTADHSLIYFRSYIKKPTADSGRCLPRDAFASDVSVSPMW